MRPSSSDQLDENSVDASKRSDNSGSSNMQMGTLFYMDERQAFNLVRSKYVRDMIVAC